MRVTCRRNYRRPRARGTWRDSLKTKKMASVIARLPSCYGLFDVTDLMWMRPWFLFPLQPNREREKKTSDYQAHIIIHACIQVEPYWSWNEAQAEPRIKRSFLFCFLEASHWWDWNVGASQQHVNTPHTATEYGTQVQAYRIRLRDMIYANILPYTILTFGLVTQKCSKGLSMFLEMRLSS